ncbi:2-deoxyuridine 5-triphosphate nucleotidohydrolase [Lactobacillus sp. LC28-10]|uniref:2-deoxyuridine 5-triphosphate nucleotidohydrolase n=1 Tax=Secundilactobacillus angelensis TaxID=2722706 RepID=A0ABX1L1V9_9LACO|nr:2-deoxyuridine 5-triphosphate nucleotidohydrolase [Secundilactobacillus angelensis]MCH5463385.1 2-deoxyuridine 5-triphosphate nucleotidohydrolase [Secundilactobacillus angelensis]NLR19490.1 2-deoxyuridine 5-triphosphate nucleotidohydrolase [Secundilactobacillus angelensis]
MTLDLANLLQTAIQRRNQFNYENHVEISQEEGLRNEYVALSTSLAHLADLMGWYQLRQESRTVAPEELLQAYLEVIEHSFQVAAKQTWSQLIVMKPADLDKLAHKRPAKSLSQQYLSILHFVDQSFFDRQQDAFRHAWHLILKLGFVDLGFSGEQIQEAYLQN